MEVTQEQTGHDPAAGFGADGKPDFWIGGEGGLNKPLHVAIVAKDRATVDAFYKAAMAAGGRDNGAPGIRAHYHPNYYGAFVLDPDGHNIEAVCHTPGDDATGMTGFPSGFLGEHCGISSVVVDADRTSRNPAADTGKANRAAARRSAGQSAIPRCRRRCASPARRRRRRNCRARRRMNCRCAGRTGPRRRIRPQIGPQGDNLSLDLKASPECAMNNCACNPLRRRNKKHSRFPARHNPA